jgi:hypothetical protein
MAKTRGPHRIRSAWQKGDHSRALAATAARLCTRNPLPARRLTRQQPVHRLVRQCIDALVNDLASMTAHSPPFHIAWSRARRAQSCRRTVLRSMATAFRAQVVSAAVVSGGSTRTPIPGPPHDLRTFKRPRASGTALGYGHLRVAAVLPKRLAVALPAGAHDSSRARHAIENETDAAKEGSSKR